jgi:SAM-dependent methyltransferase
MFHQLEKIATAIRSRGVTTTLQLVKKSLIHEARWYLDRRFDRQFHTRTSAVIQLDSLEIQSENVRHGIYYEPTPTKVLHQIIRKLAISYPEFVFCDLGSGLGRTLLIASDYPFRRIVGVEFSEVLHRQAQENIRVYRSRRQRCFSIDAVCMDAAMFPFPPDPLVVFLYNPFGPAVMAKVLANMQRSLEEQARRVVMVYYNPLSASVIEDFAFLPQKRSIALPHDYSRQIQRSVAVFHN